jgi:hypothetical protein
MCNRVVLELERELIWFGTGVFTENGFDCIYIIVVLCVVEIKFEKNDSN